MKGQGRILGIDYGLKRCGLAGTDPLQIIVNGIAWVETVNISQYLEEYIQNNEVAKIVIGLPHHKDGNPTSLTETILEFGSNLKKVYAAIDIVYQDERLSSSKAVSAIIKAGVPKEKRKNKGLVDKMSAVIILQTYLGHF